jgi:imidazole glycerol-phosphate synthase subunit HisH
MIAIISYGLGNVSAFTNVYKRLGMPCVVATTASEIEEADHIILPGVGAFDHAMDLLQRSGMREALDLAIVVKKIPVLGVCVGMQIMADDSSEGGLPGLGWVKGSVRLMTSRTQSNTLMLPHMGWNDVEPTVGEDLFSGLTGDARFYFLHSYAFQCANDENAIAHAEYDGEFTCAVRAGNVYGVQFHPEKSHEFGERLLKNFAEIH